uniref:Uncharacterized protein n=1 Tax=Myotis myotis TaxID=51298 RepID=A0A7J7RME7_MYOMY|nr:hypothetical protein mMyoMyo1_010249 [Myotis myotis]
MASAETRCRRRLSREGGCSHADEEGGRRRGQREWSGPRWRSADSAAPGPVRAALPCSLCLAQGEALVLSCSEEPSRGCTAGHFPDWQQTGQAGPQPRPWTCWLLGGDMPCSQLWDSAAQPTRLQSPRRTKPMQMQGSFRPHQGHSAGPAK